MSEHTPTPWRTDDGWALGVYDVVGPDNKPICMVAHGDIDHDLRILNARFIVKAVNNHEALVKALWLARARIEYLGIVHPALTHFEANEKTFLPAIDEVLNGPVGGPS